MSSHSATVPRSRTLLSSVYSRWYHGTAGCRELNLHTMARVARQATRIVVLSAYYSRDFLRELLKSVGRNRRRKCGVELVLRAASGARLKPQREDMEGVERYARRLGFEDVDIRLVSDHAIFHTKLFRFDRRRDVTWFVGSANASMPAFTKNEEILFRLDGFHRGLDGYVRAVIESAHSVYDVAEPRVDDLVKLWRTGSLYFRPSAQFAFTCNALDIPDNVKQALNRVATPRHANPGEPWGPFNVLRALGLRDQDREMERPKVRLSPFTIETCLGYWAPSAYVPMLEQRIEEKAAQKRQRLECIRQRFQRSDPKQLHQAFGQYLSDVRRNLRHARGVPDWKPDDNTARRRFDAFVNRLIAKLKSDTSIDRASRPFVDTPMPEIWSDTAATDDFRRSFFEYTAVKVDGPSVPQIVTRMRRRVGFRSGDDADAIEQQTRQWLETNGWNDEYW